MIGNNDVSLVGIVVIKFMGAKAFLCVIKKVILVFPMCSCYAIYR